MNVDCVKDVSMGLICYVGWDLRVRSFLQLIYAILSKHSGTSRRCCVQVDGRLSNGLCGK